jgi:transcriptional regulator with XRE-family HTH domain
MPKKRQVVLSDPTAAEGGGPVSNLELVSERLGAKIRRIRNAERFTLSDLGEKTGLSVSFLSQVERGHNDPSINSLRKIANALGCPLTTFFEDRVRSAGPVVRKHERRVLFNTQSHLTYQLLSRFQGGRIELLMTMLEPGTANVEQSMSHTGEEAALIIQGECWFELGDEGFSLKEGDAIYIQENKLHRFTNTGSETLIIVSAISPPGF